MKILRISPEIHDAFKELCKRESIGLTEGTEILINSALKKGTLKEVKQNVFNQIQSLDSTFRSWMKQQEKTVLTGISEDLIILSRRFKDVSTKSENENLLKNGINKIELIVNDSLCHYEHIIHRNIEKKVKLYSYIKKASMVMISIVIISLASSIIIKGRNSEYKLDARNYHRLIEYCKIMEKEQHIELLTSFEKWKMNQDFSNEINN